MASVCSGGVSVRIADAHRLACEWDAAGHPDISHRRRDLGPILLAVVLWLGAFAFSLSNSGIYNDHFDRISRGRQIARFGELPFRDFFDPGFLATEFSSAAVQLIFGDTLLGELLLTSTFIASGTLFVFLLARRASPSTTMALAAALLGLIAIPRPYDYDKVFFYPLGILLCWRYIERPVLGRVIALGAGAVVAGMYRYDSAVYIAGASAVAMAVVHAGTWRRLSRHLAALVLVIGCLAGPVVVFLYSSVGIGDTVDQVLTYANREGTRTRISSPPRVSLGPLASLVWGQTPTSGVDASDGPASVEVASGYLYYLARFLPTVVALFLLLDAGILMRASRAETARIACLVAFCGLLVTFVLRQPPGPRFGGIAGPLFVLLLWAGRWLWQATPTVARWVTSLSFGVILALTVWSLALLGEWNSRTWTGAMSPSHLRAVIDARATSPPSLDMVVPMAGLVSYLRECTRAEDYVFAAWFAPELYFFARRGFAAGTVVTFGGHWSEPRFDRRARDLLASQSVPIAVLLNDNQLDEHPELAGYLEEHYSLAGQAGFGDPGAPTNGYLILVRKGLTPARIHAASSLPCYA